jgi:dihydroorotate dehydrogenase
VSYRALFARVLSRLDAETAHRLGVGALALVQAVPGLAGLLRRRLRPPGDRGLAVRAMGLDFASPLGVAAGFDKDARVPLALGALGFAFVEVGTVTARPQPGNPRPRLFRLPADRALVNRMGFNNEGAEAVARRLARLRRRAAGMAARPVVGVNIGRSKAAAEDEAVADYVAGARRLGPLADYLVVNVSSPNTPGLRDLQSAARLRELLVAVREALDAAVPERRVPLLAKIAPDLADADVDAIADLALELRLDGLIATNTTTARRGLRTSPAAVAAAGAGGLSGAPLAPRALSVLRRLRAKVGNHLVLIAVGGVERGVDVDERLAAGATLVQAYTGFVYGGPRWPSQVLRDVAVRRTAGDSEGGRG